MAKRRKRRFYRDRFGLFISRAAWSRRQAARQAARIRALRRREEDDLFEAGTEFELTVVYPRKGG